MQTSRVVSVFSDLKNLVFVVWLLPWFAHAQTEQSDAEVAIYSGAINQEKVDAFLNRYMNKHVPTLRMNSHGGLVLPAIPLGRWVDANHLAVSVRNLCMSACANYVFTAGGRKTIEPGAIVVRHGMAWHGSAEQKEYTRGAAPV